MPLLRRLPALGQSTLIGVNALGVVKKLWSLKQASNGVELEAFLLYDSSLGEAAIKISVKAAHADEVFAEEAAEKFRQWLLSEGAKEMVAEEVSV
jgi:hypothetical protein